MTIEWIKAPLALKYVALGEYDYPAQLKICERAHSGLIASKAEKVVWGDSEDSNRTIPKNFWWADGREALDQDWEAGDFSTWIDGKIEVRAFGVSFDFLALSDLVSADKQAIALRSISVIAEEDWISTHELVRQMYEKHGPAKAPSAMLEAGRLGLISGRAMRAVGEGRAGLHGVHNNRWAAIEWDIPLWFWRSFTDPTKSSYDWQLGKVRGRGIGPFGPDYIELQGVHFHRSGLANLGLAQSVEDAGSGAVSKRGRKAEYDWQAASTAIWGQIVRGDLIPKNQAQIERAMQGHLTRGDKEPSESSVRPYAKQIWKEYSKA